MKRNQELANRLNEVLLNGQWIANTNFKAQLEGLTCKQATHRFGTLNSIALLTYHVNYYLAGLIQVFNGGPLEIRDKFSFDLGPMHSDADWELLKHKFLMNAELFIEKVANMNEDHLMAVFVDRKYGTWLRNIEGVIEHCYYHLGQISLIRKMIFETEKQ
jgi:hypothetical protein